MQDSNFIIFYCSLPTGITVLEFCMGTKPITVITVNRDCTCGNIVQLEQESKIFTYDETSTCGEQGGNGNDAHIVKH